MAEWMDSLSPSVPNLVRKFVLSNLILTSDRAPDLEEVSGLTVTLRSCAKKNPFRLALCSIYITYSL